MLLGVVLVPGFLLEMVSQDFVCNSVLPAQALDPYIVQVK